MAYGDAPEAAPDMGGDDLYSDGGAEAPKDEAKPESDEGNDKGDSVEGVLPKGILAGKEFNVGDEVVLEITGIHGNEVTVKYAPAKKGADKGGEGEAKMPASMDKGNSDYD